MANVQSIRILSTRALGEHVVQQFRKNGWYLEMVPMIETKGILDPALAETFIYAISIEDSPFMLVLTSLNGVKWLKKGLAEAGHFLPPGITALCVGKKSAAKAAEQLKAVPLLIAPDGKSLLELIKIHIPRETRLIYACAKSRLDTLPEGLKNEGYQCLEFPVYETMPAPKMVAGDFNFILFFSPSAVESYFSLNAWPPGAQGVCIGDTTANALRHHGVNDILVPSSPDENEMVDVIRHFFELRKN